MVIYECISFRSLSLWIHLCVWNGGHFSSKTNMWMCCFQCSYKSCLVQHNWQGNNCTLFLVAHGSDWKCSVVCHRLQCFGLFFWSIVAHSAVYLLFLNREHTDHWLFLPTANPLAQNQHLSPASQTFLLPILITSVDTDSPPPLLLALRTSLAFISPSLSLLVLLRFRQRWRQQLSDETTIRSGRMAP